MTAESSTQTSTAPQAARRQRTAKVGIVTSDVRDKTIAVTVEFLFKHAKYGKQIRRRSVLHAHDEKNEARKDDRVEIRECRPMSKSKHWRLVRIITAAPREDLA